MDQVLAEVEDFAGIEFVAVVVRVGDEGHSRAFAPAAFGLVRLAVVARDHSLDRFEDFLDRGFAFVPHPCPRNLAATGRYSAGRGSGMSASCAGMSTVRLDCVTGSGSCAQSQMLLRIRS